MSSLTRARLQTVADRAEVLLPFGAFGYRGQHRKYQGASFLRLISLTLFSFLRFPALSLGLPALLDVLEFVGEGRWPDGPKLAGVVVMGARHYASATYRELLHNVHTASA
jgi:hypothetical protein